MAEGARLESVYTGNRIEGSNPSPSATSSVFQRVTETFSCLHTILYTVEPLLESACDTLLSPYQPTFSALPSLAHSTEHRLWPSQSHLSRPNWCAVMLPAHVEPWPIIHNLKSGSNVREARRGAHGLRKRPPTPE